MQLMSLYRSVAKSFVRRTISRHAAHVAVSFCREIVCPPNNFATCSSCRCIVLSQSSSFVHRTISRHAAHVAVSFCRKIVRPPNNFATCSSCRCIVLFVHRTISRHAAHVAEIVLSRNRSSTERFRDMQLMSLKSFCREIVRPPNDFTTCSSCRCIVRRFRDMQLAKSFVHRSSTDFATCSSCRCIVLSRNRSSTERFRDMQLMSLYRSVAKSFVHRTISRHAAHVAKSFVHRTISRHAVHVAVSFCREIVRPSCDFTTCSSCRCIVLSRNRSSTERFHDMQLMSLYRSVEISFVHRTISRHAALVAVSFVSRNRSVTTFNNVLSYVPSQPSWRIVIILIMLALVLFVVSMIAYSCVDQQRR